MAVSVAKRKEKDRVSVMDLRAKSLKIRLRVQFDRETVPIYYYEEIVGYLMPADRAESLPIVKFETCKITEFRRMITESWEKLQTDTDCIWLEYHNRRVMAFVSPEVFEETIE